MSKTILNVVQHAYRATAEEQDDPIVWLSRAMRGAGTELGVLLEGNAVCYGLRGQDASGLRIGTWQQTQPPRIADEVAGLMKSGVPVWFVEEDAEARGLEASALLDGLQSVSRAKLAQLFARYDQVHRW